MKKLCLLLALAQTSCPGTLFKEIGNHLAAPISIAIDTTQMRAYVVNSNNNEEFTSATLSILDLTSPTAPALLASAVNPIVLSNFSGQIYLDGTSRLAYIPNRLSDNSDDKIDSLLRINLDETSASFGTIDSYASGENPFSAGCCDPAGRIYVVSVGGTVNVYNPADLSASTQISLRLTLPSGESFSGKNSTEVVLLGTQAFVTNPAGDIYVINTSEVGDTSKNPIDYLLTKGGVFRGIATDGTLLYLVDATKNATLLRVLNPGSLTPIDPDSSSITEVDVSSLQTTSVSLEKDPNEIVIFKGMAYVTNRGSDSVSVIDLATNTLATTIAVGDEPFGLTAFTLGGTDYLYVTNLVSNSISIIDLASNTVVGTFAP